MTRIDQAVLFTNGMVAVFDEQGEQMGEYQGHYGAVVDDIIAAGYTGKWILAQWDHTRTPPWVTLAHFIPRPEAAQS